MARPGGTATASQGEEVSSGAGRYRSKVVILRDLLDAASRAHRKTRIIGLANLNQESFQRYAALAVSAGLLREEKGYYATTPRAKEWLRAVDSVLRKGSEVSTALASLSRLTRQTLPPLPSTPEETGEIARQLLGRLAWAELSVLEAEETPAPRPDALQIAARVPPAPLLTERWPGPPRTASPVPTARRAR
ncbi:MAG TPA: winged helix-turn-helix domain-containing protein [Thermoplasmata archaeon]|nr:winged helix-turn-helix domain-containing protein [Thermoplasmata archaeon]